MNQPDLLIPPRKIECTGDWFHGPFPLSWYAPENVGDLLLSGPRVTAAQDASLRLTLDPSLDKIDEYTLTIHPETIELQGCSPAALFHGLQTLNALQAQYPDRLPTCRIEDWADFKRRGLYYDCSRGKVPTLDTLFELIDRLAAWKMNELQLYVENVFDFRLNPRIGQGFDPFTADDFKRLQAYCRERHIRFVGSLASLGHMETLLALPEYTALGELPGYRGYPGGLTLCAVDPESLKLVRSLYEEFVPLFESDDFNLCGDEPWELGRGRSREEVERRGAGTVYAEFISSLYQDLREKYGKRVNMWGDVVANHPEILDQIPRDVVMLNWEYNAEGARFSFGEKIREQGFPLVICPGTNAWQSHGSRLSTAIQNVSGFASAGRTQGAEGLLMTDWGDGGHRNFLGASLISMAHAAAHAWNGRAVNDETFPETACREVLEFENPAEACGHLRLLGDASPTYPQALYLSLVHPIDPQANPTEGLDLRTPLLMMSETAPHAVDKAREEEMHEIIDSVNPNAIGCASPETADDFATTARRELALAARMDVLAARKILIAKALRSGSAVDAGECAVLAEDIREMADLFSALWLKRNRPSRLNDNMLLLRRAAEEIDQSAL